MRFLMKQKILCFGDDFAITDESGREIFYIDGKAFSFGKNLVFLDSNKNQLAKVRQKLLTFRPTYKVSSQGQVLAVIYKRLLTFRKTFYIDVPGPDDITVVGKLLEHEYKFYRNSKEIANCSKKYFRSKDTYGVDIEKEKDILLVLCAAVVIDLICHPKRDSSF